MVGLADRLREALSHSGVAVPLGMAPAMVEALHPIRGRFRAELRPLLRVGQDAWIWHSPTSLIDRHGAARVLDELASRYPAQSLHLLLHPLPAFGQVMPWALEMATYLPGETQARCSGLVMGEGQYEWESVLQYLTELATQCQLSRGSELRTFWRESLAGGPFRHWLEAELVERMPAKENPHALTQSWTSLWSSFAGLSAPRLERLEAQIQLADAAVQDDLWILGLGWILNQPSARKPHPAKGTTGIVRSGRQEPFRSAWKLNDFQGLEGHPELWRLVNPLLAIRPLSFHGMERAALGVPQVDYPWVDHFVSTALREIVSSALQQAHIHGEDPEDLFQEGVIGALDAAARYEAYDEEGVFRNFRVYASYWVWQRMQRHCHNLSHLIRHPAAHYHDGIDGRIGVAWACEPEGLCPAQRMTPIVPLMAGLNDPMGKGAMTVGEVLTWGGERYGPWRPLGPHRVQDQIRSDVEPFELAETALMVERAQQLLGCLTQREEKILRMRFGVDDGGAERTLEEIGQVFGVTRERIRQLEARALRKSRHPKYSKSLRPFLDPVNSPVLVEPLLVGPAKPHRESFRVERTVSSIKEALDFLGREYGEDNVPGKIGVPANYVLRWKAGCLPQQHFLDCIQSAVELASQRLA